MICRSTENSGTIHPPPGHANYNLSAKAYYNIHGYVTIHISILLHQVYNPPLRIPQYVFKYNYNYRWVSRMGFPTQLKCNKVGINKEKTLRVIVREKLSERAVVKEDGLGQVCLQERRLTPIGT